MTFTRPPLADYHLSQGAQPGEYHGASVPARFTDPVSEHEAVRKSAGLCDYSFRAKFALKGRDSAKFLHRIVSNDIKNLHPGHGVYTTLLDPKGHILADFYVYAAEDRLLVDIDADLREKAIAILRRYIIADQVEIEPLDLCSLSLDGPNARAVLEKTLHVDIPALDDLDHFATNYGGFPVRVVARDHTGEAGYELWAGANGMLGLWGAACGQAPTYSLLACGTEALESLRIEAGIPRCGSELGEDTLPLEANLMNAISTNKGCYIGQEIVERARSRGHVNWKLVGVTANEAAQAPERSVSLRSGERLLSDGSEVGEITSSCFSPTLNRPIALGYVRREHAEPGTMLVSSSGVSIEVKSLPFYRRDR